MRWIGLLLITLVFAACGGGGGDSGSSLYGGGGSGSATTTTTTDGTTATGAAAITLGLQDASGNAISGSLSGTQIAFVVATVRRANGSVPTSRVIVNFAAPGLVFKPTNGSQVTDLATGVARIQIQATDPFAGGAVAVSASTTVDTVAVQGTLALSLDAATSSLGNLTASSASVDAYQTIQVSIPVTLSGTSQPAAQYPVGFRASCGTFDPTTVPSGSDGVARSTYRNQIGANACSGNVTLTAFTASVSATTQVTANAPVAANIQFVSSAPNRIYLAGSPGVSQSLVKFKLVDSSGNAVVGEKLRMELTLRPNGVYLGSTAGTAFLEQSTSSTGEVTVAVNAGSAPGPVQIQASMVSNVAIKNVSNSLSVASGLPTQNAFSLSVSTFNIEAWDEDGVATDITLRIADRLGNPVPDGTTVNFIAEGGQVVASCNTTGAAVSDVSACSVVLKSQNPRPLDGRISVLAWAQGEESFVDNGVPTNNVFDSGESFDDLGQPFLDKNENGVFDIGSDVTVGAASGASACPAGAALSVPNTCDGAWGQNLVRASAVIIFSGSTPTLINPTRLSPSGVKRCAMTFSMVDLHGNPMPSGTSLAVSNVAGGGASDITTGQETAAIFEGFGLGGNKVPNTSASGGTQHSAIFSNCVTPGNVTFKLTATTPRKQVATSFFLP
ncbi:MAG: hypothetical protein AB3X44_13700 [Leptothrix sp. (in: b-proteobacteria)]